MSRGWKAEGVSKPGRNDLCPCGSSKKYKRCCLGKEAWRDDFTRSLTTRGLPLLRELGRFAAQRTSSPPEVIAAERFPFWHPPLDKIRAARLLDYLIFDYRPTTHGRTAIQQYLAERGPIVSPEWRELLEGWQSVSMRLFALEQWSAGFARCRAALPDDGRVIDVMPLETTDVAIAPGAPVAIRALPVGVGFVYASSPSTFGSRSTAEVIAAIVARHHDFVRRERIVSLEEFLRLEGTAFDEEAAGPAPSPIIVPGRV